MLNWNSKQIKKQLTSRIALAYLVSGVLFFGLIAFAEKKHSNRTCQNLVIRLQNNHENRFVTESQVRHMLNKNESRPIEGLPLNRLNLRELEQDLLANPFISKAEISYDIKGNLKADVWQERPIARFFFHNNEDKYLSEHGGFLPYNSHFTARVMIIEPWDARQMKDTALVRQLYQLARFIQEDAFWQKQIAQVSLNKEGELYLYPQIGKQKIIFGKPERLEAKFKKLKRFYDEIIPFKGYNTYSTVNLKFEDQIICE